jgi:Mg/Co/Ni transporter MgtE
MLRFRHLIKALVKEHLASVPRKMPYDEMAPILDDLAVRYQSGELSQHEYDREYEEVLRASGWSPLEFEQEIDRRWDFVDQLKAVPPKVRYRN